jgi:hypothetical protein
MYTARKQSSISAAIEGAIAIDKLKKEHAYRFIVSEEKNLNHPLPPSKYSTHL